MTKQIDIKELIPYMKKGWVACDKDGTWKWYSKKPLLCINDKDERFNFWMPALNSKMQYLFINDIAFRKVKRPKDWTKSLIRIKGE